MNRPGSNRWPRRGQKGFTLIELMFAIAISSLVMVAVASLQYISGRAIKDVYGETRTRQSRTMSLDQIRYRLCNAEVGTLSVSQPNEEGNGYHRIEFVDPNLGGGTSVFYFVPTTRTLYYDGDIDDDTAAVEAVVGPIDVAFETRSSGELIYLYVKSTSAMAGGDVDTQDGETLVYLRNY